MRGRTARKRWNMPCLTSEDGRLIICRPDETAVEKISVVCPLCKAQTDVLIEHYEWYGPRCTCLTCGDVWEDGELCPRPFMPRWRQKSVADAMKRWKRYQAATRQETGNANNP